MSQIESTESSAELPSKVPSAPPLGVLHLLLWTLCSALYLAVMRVTFSMQVDGSVAVLRQSYGTIHSIIAGAVITGAIILVWARVRRGPPMLWHPGHWVLFAWAIANLGTLLVALTLAVSSGSLFTGTTYGLVLGTVYLVPALTFSFAAHYQHYRAHDWRIMFVALSLIALSQSALYYGIAFSPGAPGLWVNVLSTIPMWGNVMLATAMLFASIVEIITGPKRDWLHWIGIITQMAQSCSVLIWMYL